MFTDWQPQLLIAAKLSGIPLRAGYPRENPPLSKHLTKQIHPHVFRSTDYAAETNARVFSDALGITLDGDMTRPDIGAPTEAEHAHVSRLLEQIGLKKGTAFFLLSLFASLAERSWPLNEAAYFVKLAEARFSSPLSLSAHRKKKSRQKKFPDLI